MNKEQEEMMFLENKKLIYSVINQMNIKSFYWITNDDFYQMGSIGLLHAIRTFDESKGCQFSSYAMLVIRHEIIKSLRTKDKMNFSQSLNVPIYDTEENESELINLIPDKGESVSDIAECHELVNNIMECITLFTKRYTNKERNQEMLKDWIFTDTPRSDLLNKYQISRQRANIILNKFRRFLKAHKMVF